jgi:2-amino-4-hydroxy-6-hydroxymethyldihydropteridine diphosphokinase
MLRSADMPTAYLALGSNLNMPRRQLSHAFRNLRHLPRSALCARSKIYLTKPIGVKAQSNYFNVVIAIKTQLSPYALFLNCKKIEQKQRRIHKKIWGSRSIDIDILLYDQISMQKRKLTIPHAQLLYRDFVIVPLLELSPNQCLPNGNAIVLAADLPKTIIRAC